MALDPIPRPYAGVAERVPRGVLPAQTVAEVEPEDVVVFLIGMRFNRWRKVRSWFPAFVGMPRMLAELAAHPEDGLLGARTYWSGRVLMVVQYWRSAEQLGAYARRSDRAHAPAWSRFNRTAARTGDVGVFHETYVVPREQVESRYLNMPPFGLGAAHVAAARGRRPGLTGAERRMGVELPAPGSVSA